MLPSPHLRPPQPSEQQRLATYLEAQQVLNYGPTSYLLQPRWPVYRNNTPILTLYTPYRAHGSTPQIPPPVQQGVSQEDLLRRKTPAGTLPDAYNGAPMEWPRRPTKHILLPLSIGMRNGQYDLQKQAGSFQGVQQPALPVSINPTADSLYSRSEAWANINSGLWTNSGVNPTVNQNDQEFSTLTQAVSRQVEPIYSNGSLPPSFNTNRLTQQPALPVQTAAMADWFTIGGAGMGGPVAATGGWYMTDNGVFYPLEGYSPMQQQLNSSVYQINTPITPSSFHEIQSFIGCVPSWTQQQAQIPQAINAPVTSPYPIALCQPFVADPIHHTRGFDAMNGGAPGVANYIHNILPNRSRVLSWAHGVYADLVQATQVHQVSQAGTQLLSQPPVRPLAQADTGTSVATYQHRLRNQQFTPTEAPSNCTTPTPQADDPTEDNFDRRKKRRIDIVSDIQTPAPHARRPRRNTAPGYSPHLYNSSGSVTPVDNGGFRDNDFPKDDQLRTAMYQSNSHFDGGQYGHMLNRDNAVGPQMKISTPIPNMGAMITPGSAANRVSRIMGSTGEMMNPAAVKIAAYHALDTLQQLCAESGWRWLDGMLLGGCIAYALGDLNRALGWYLKLIEVDPMHVEALSNLGATLLALGRRADAEEYWLRAVKARPSYFEAVEHLVGLLCGEQRGRDAVALIEFVERSVKRRSAVRLDGCDMSVCSSSSECSRASVSLTSSPEMKFDYFEDDEDPATPIPPLSGQPECLISSVDNGRLLGLIHAKGNMLYTLGDNAGAAKAFEDAVLIGAGREKHGIKGLIQRILDTLAPVTEGYRMGGRVLQPVLLTPEKALKTAQLVFPPNGELPGLRDLPSGTTRRIAISTTSNSLLSLAKIFQDGMSSSAGGSGLVSAGVKEILALYYLSLSLHPSPSTANNVGILLASVQQTSPVSNIPDASNLPGYTHGSGVGLALLYYQYGLMLDPRHAHLYTNLGSLLKDINNLPMAIKMYEQAVLCDGTFDIALANLANAVKDQGRTSEAIKYYRRAVAVNPNFAEAVCGLANALNSVCDWKGRGGVVKGGGALDRWHVNEDGSLFDAKASGAVSRGWMGRVVSIVEKQLEEGEHWGKGILIGNVLETLLREVEVAVGGGEWPQERRETLRTMVVGWAGKKNEGAKVVRLIERAARRAVWRWYQEKYIKLEQQSLESYLRPTLPSCLSIPSAPTVLPFHTFTCPLSAQQVRMISQRNGIRISCSTMRAPWLSAHVYPPPAPPSPHLNVGYISSDFNNHPLAHLMQSVFGMHDSSRVKAHCYATTPSDNSPHRLQIEREAPRFYDTSCWGPDQLINQIVEDGIHILVNLNGFTRGAKNEIFAARPAPIQMSFMGFAGSLGADWCDYLLADDTAVPPDTVRPWRRNVDLEDSGHEDGDDGDWVYCENIVFTKYSFFCCDHRQSAPDAKGPGLSWEAELRRRWRMRKELFPDLPDDTVILGNFNQLYKIEPTTFRTWLRIIAKVPNTRLWLLRFPDLGEKNLRELAEKWAGPEVAERILFTDVAPKLQHIARARVCDIFLDTPECNAHTTAADVTWSGTPLLTLPRHKYKMCSRIAASIVRAAVPPTTEGKKVSDKLIAENEEDYERRAVNLASGLRYEWGGNGIATGELMDIRKVLFEGRWTSPLFDTKRWVRDLETAYELAWKRWVDGEGGDIRLL